MNQMQPTAPLGPVLVENSDGRSCVVVVCEHASCFIPPAYGDLGLDDAARQSHIAWDLGAFGVARALATRLDAALVASNVSRLVYDCNRPPSAPDAMPAQSEAIPIPGNANLTTAQRNDRASHYYDPFQACLAATIAAKKNPVIVTLHSFTPIYHGRRRAVEIGILHDADARLANAMVQVGSSHTQAKVEINAPYGPKDGVTHTLKEHAIGGGHLNVMLEIRNDLISDPVQHAALADCFANWLTDALAVLDVSLDAPC